MVACNLIIHGPASHTQRGWNELLKGGSEAEALHMRNCHYRRNRHVGIACQTQFNFTKEEC